MACAVLGGGNFVRSSHAIPATSRPLARRGVDRVAVRPLRRAGLVVAVQAGGGVNEPAGATEVVQIYSPGSAMLKLAAELLLDGYVLATSSDEPGMSNAELTVAIQRQATSTRRRNHPLVAVASDLAVATVHGMNSPLCCCLALLATVSLCGASEADDLLDGLRFSDGVSRSVADFAGQNVVLYFFCGHCPTAMGSLGEGVKQAVDWIEQERKPAWVVCITPDVQPSDLVGLAQGKGITNALMAHDPRNRLKISTKNIRQTQMMGPDGAIWSESGMKWYQATLKDKLIAAETRKPGTFRIPVEGLTDPKVTAAWWMVERGTGKGALKELTVVAKKKGPMAEQAQKVIDAAQMACTAALAAAGDGLAAYETVERLVGRFDGFDPKPLKTRLSELSKDAKVKEELKAREIWLKCQAALASPKPKEQATGRDGLAQLAKKMPDTVYGKRAGSESAKE